MEKNAEQGFNCMEGKLLVASPNLDDNCFEKSLVYLCAHDKDGAIGVIINHKIGAITAQELAKFAKIQSKGSIDKKFPVLFGGPVYTDKVVVLCMNKHKEKILRQHQGVTLYTDLEHFLHEYSKGHLQEKLLFAKGVAIWESGQLEAEVESNAWFLVPTTADFLFSQRIKDKWSAIMRDLGVESFHNLVCYSGNA